MEGRKEGTEGKMEEERSALVRVSFFVTFCGLVLILVRS